MGWCEMVCSPNATASAFSRVRTVSTRRGAFAFRQSGVDSDIPVVLLHGWPESSYAWRLVVQHLRADIRIIAPDVRGHGDSTRHGDRHAYEKQALGMDMLELLDQLEVDRFQLVGHDWGGPIAQEMALLVPDRASRLVLLNTPVINNAKGIDTATRLIRENDSRHYWYQHFQQQHDLPERMLPGKEEAWLRHFLRTARGQQLPDDVIAEHVRWYSIPGTPRACANLYRTIRQDRTRWNGLVEHVWPMPSLYIYGYHDPVIIPAYLSGIDTCFDDVRVERIDAGHFVHEEAPVAVATLLNDFLLTTEAAT